VHSGDDQRHAVYPPDVLTFETEVLTEDVTVAGEILPNCIHVSTDADFIVKLIDVYQKITQLFTQSSNILWADISSLFEVKFSGRFRNSFENRTIQTDEITDVNFPYRISFILLRKDIK
jgi:hypothetical protein